MRDFSRVLSGLAGPLGIVLAILFFMPWIEISCQNSRVATQSGWQLTTGHATLSAAVEKDETESDDGNSDAKYGYVAGLLVPLAVMLVSLLSLRRIVGRRAAGALLVAFGAAGLLVVVLAANVDYTDDILADARQETDSSQANSLLPKVVAGLITTEPLAALWVSLVLYVLTLLCGAGVLATPPPSPSRRPAPLMATPAEPDG